jgi:hypothetical protein
MNVKKTFINLTKFTYTHGTEALLEHHLPKGIEKDKYDNYFIKIGESETMFTCHLDTATSKFEKVKHVFENNFIKTDGSTVTADAVVKIDRTKYEIKYGSGKFFENLGDKAIYDDFDI